MSQCHEATISNFTEECTVEKKRLTILPRLNSLNHDPGVSFGHDDILTCGQQQQQKKKQNRMLASDSFSASFTRSNLKELFICVEKMKVFL